MRLLKIIPNANVSSNNATLGSNLRNHTKLEKVPLSWGKKYRATGLDPWYYDKILNAKVDSEAVLNTFQNTAVCQLSPFCGYFSVSQTSGMSTMAWWHQRNSYLLSYSTSRLIKSALLASYWGPEVMDKLDTFRKPARSWICVQSTHYTTKQKKLVVQLL